MGQSDESPSQLSGLLGPTLIVAIGGLVAYFTFEPALESRRPDLSNRPHVPKPPSVPGLNAIHARLWDDPLAVAFADSQNRHGESDKSWALWRNFASKANCLNETETSVQRYFATVAGNFLKRRHGKGRFVCLPVLVPGEPYDSDSETRRRITYAVLSALGTCGYELSVPNQLSYVELPVVVDIAAVNEPVCLERFVVPAKLLQRAEVRDKIPNPDGPDGVLVLWINEHQLGRRPLAVIGQILEGLFQDPRDQKHEKTKHRIEIRIVGPTDSTTLLDMARENANWHSKSWNHPQAQKSQAYRAATEPRYFLQTYANKPTLYSGRATLSAWALDDEGRQESAKSELSQFIYGKSNQSGLSVVRTIGSDRQLAQLLARELKLRGVWPLRDDEKLGPDSVRDEELRHIVLVTENDTLYGSAFPAVIRKAFPKLLKSSNSNPEQDKDLLHVFTYLHGLDGKISGDKKEKEEGRSDTSKTAEADSDPLSSPHPESIPASGRSQFDYLRRLEQQLVEFDESSRNAGEAGITAIGVVGTDIYDKLLVLRALRKKFPRTWFFTTDVDAAFSLPSEYPTTRNLLVASHFGLTLHPELQKGALPFRDVYETAVYFSTLCALDHDGTRAGDGARFKMSESPDPWGLQYESDKNAVQLPWLNPLVFEIGRNGPYQLTMPARTASEYGKKVQPPGLRERHWLDHKSHAWGAFALALIAGAGVYGLSKDVRKTTRIICRVWRRDDWTLARTLLRILVVLLAVPFLMLLFAAVKDHMNPDGEPFVLFEGISIWPPIIVRYIVLGLSAGFIAKTVDNGLRELQQSGSEESLFMLCETTSGPAGSSSQCGTAFADFRKPARWWLYLLWSAIPAVVFFAFGNLLLLLTESSPTPYRGEVAEQWQTNVMLLSAIAMIYLTFLVIAHVEYCRQFVNKLGGQPADWLSAEMDKLKQDRLPVKPADVGELLTVRIIARSTQMAGKLVKYPFIALFVMICSRHPALDKLELPWSLVVIWALLVAGLSWMAHAMRHDAAIARDAVLGRLRDSLSFAMYLETKTSPASRRVQQLRQFISEVEREAGGAFQPLVRDPLVQALALGASGGLMFIHQFLP